VFGGEDNRATARSAAVVGGGVNTATGETSGVVAGILNTASGVQSFIGGGFNNTASGPNGATLGGSENRAAGENSLALGHLAHAEHDNSFVWSATGERGAGSTGPNQFVVGTTGAVRFMTDPERGVGVSIAPGGGSWSAVSDREAKTAIEETQGLSVLEKVLQLPISEFSYRSQGEDIRHLGPMAQDFHPLFGLGEDERSISAMNLAGVSLAAIQGLAEENRVLSDRVHELEERLARLEAMLDAMSR